MRKLALFLPVILAFLGCGKGPTGPRGPAGAERIYVLGQVDSKSQAWVTVYFPPVIPWVTINQDTLSMWEDRIDPTYDYYGTVFIADSVSVSAGDLANLKVDYTEGIAIASAGVPGNFDIISPDTSQTAQIPVNSSFTVTWSTSSHADFYPVYFHLNYSYYDTSGNYGYFNLYVDTSITSTSITFPASRLFPGDIDSIRYSGGYFGVSAMSGPEVKPGARGNVTGDGSGFFWGRNYGVEIYVAVQGTKTKAAKKPPKEELTNKLFEKIREMDPNYQLLKERWLSKGYKN